MFQSRVENSFLHLQTVSCDLQSRFLAPFLCLLVSLMGRLTNAFVSVLLEPLEPLTQTLIFLFLHFYFHFHGDVSPLFFQPFHCALPPSALPCLSSVKQR